MSPFNSYDLLFDFNKNYASILYRFRDIAICRKLPILADPTCIWRPRRERPGSNFSEIFGIRKLETLCNVACVILCLAVLVELRLVTDTDTDRHRPQHTPH